MSAKSSQPFRKSSIKNNVYISNFINGIQDQIFRKSKKSYANIFQKATKKCNFKLDFLVILN